MFLKEVFHAHQGWIYLIKNAVKTVILWNIITIWNNGFLLFFYILKCNLFLWCKAEFSAANTPVFDYKVRKNSIYLKYNIINVFVVTLN